jgi:hypothetical protein
MARDDWTPEKQRELEQVKRDAEETRAALAKGLDEQEDLIAQTEELRTEDLTSEDIAAFKERVRQVCEEFGIERGQG